MASLTNKGIPLSSISPRYLHTISTSQTFFSAVAQLSDNAYDPDVSAKQFWIDKTVIKDQDCLIFMDNGKGMDYEKMHKMFSFGFSDKQTIRGHVPVGLYGNGFKSGSMRLGKDAIVFSKKADTMCVGLLSQTYLEKIKAQNVIVPIVMSIKTGQTVRTAPEHAECLRDILTHSLFNTKEELLNEFSVINRLCTNSSGTRIIIWNLRRRSSGELEVDLMKDRYDIRIPVDVYESTKETNKRQAGHGISVPESEYSLRAYCSILYLKPRMQIILRGLKVETQFVTKTLAKVYRDTYKPACLKEGITITFGYSTKSKEHYGLMMYHKNRLIKAYERVACQRKANSTGVGVIGVIESNYLTPTHNKQDFENTDEYRKTMLSVGAKLEDYWKEVHYRHTKNCTEPFEDIVNKPDQNWVQCDDCLKWQKLPGGIDPKQVPKKWFCHMNSDPQFRSCTVKEEPEDSDDEQPRYQKTYKQHEKNQKLQEEKNRQQTEEEQRTAALNEQDTALLRKEQDLMRQLRFGANSTGVGVIGVIESNYLTPTHNKQDFENTDEYRKTMLSVGAKLEDYWKEVHYRHTKNCTEPFEDIVNKPDQYWIQCDDCLKWRKLPDGIDPKQLPKMWLCHMNSDPQFRSCTVEEEPEDSDDEQPRYQKTYKQHEKNQKLQEEKNRQQSPSTPRSSIQRAPSSMVNSSSLTGSSPSVNNSVITHFTAFPSTPTGKKRALSPSQENPEKKSARMRPLLDIQDIPSTSTALPEAFCLPAMFMPYSDGNKGVRTDIKTEPKDSGDDVIDKSTVKKEQSNEFTQTSSEDLQNYKVLYLQVKEEIKQIQQKLREQEKEQEKLKGKVDSLKDEKCTLLTCWESLQKEHQAKRT